MDYELSCDCNMNKQARDTLPKSFNRTILINKRFLYLIPGCCYEYLILPAYMEEDFYRKKFFCIVGKFDNVCACRESSLQTTKTPVCCSLSCRRQTPVQKQRESWRLQVISFEFPVIPRKETPGFPAPMRRREREFGNTY